jgi:tripartite-type tricarboxylate transporter receptor subunit TctC
MEVNMKKNRIFTFFLMALMVFTLSTAWAGYPEKPIQLIVPFGAGGSTDLAARVMASVIPTYLGQPVVVINKKGGGGQIGLNYVSKAKPDGYTMMEATIGPLTIAPAMHKKSPFSYKNFKAVARTEVVPAVLATRPDKRWKDLKGLIEFLKNNPGKLKISIAGPASLSDLGMKSFMVEAGIPIENAIGVPFSGTADALAAVLGKHADILYANLSPVFDHIKAGSLIGLGITTVKRVKSLPDVPTFTELGYPKANVMGWKGIVAHKNLPDDIVKIWGDAIQKTMKNKAWKKFQKKLGSIPAYLGPSDFTAYMESQFKSFRQIAIDNNLLTD